MAFRLCVMSSADVTHTITCRCVNWRLTHVLTHHELLCSCILCCCCHPPPSPAPPYCLLDHHYRMLVILCKACWLCFYKSKLLSLQWFLHQGILYLILPAFIVCTCATVKDKPISITHTYTHTHTKREILTVTLCTHERVECYHHVTIYPS